MDEWLRICESDRQPMVLIFGYIIRCVRKGTLVIAGTFSENQVHLFFCIDLKMVKNCCVGFAWLEVGSKIKTSPRTHTIYFGYS